MIEIPNFTVEKELGRGGMATVYLAVQDMLSRNVALKVMLPDMARDENFRKSFLSEGKIIANLEHPNIVRIHDFGIIDDSILYMAMEYLADGTLKEKLTEGELPYDKAVKIVEDTSAGLSYAHAKGYIHRDIKPGNILFREDGTAVITDFGIAKLQDTSGELTRMGYTMGTVQYMSPEQAVTTDLDHRSDIYSLGLVFYEMLTGQKAFKAESTIQAIHQHTTVAPPALPLKYSYLQPIIDKVLAKEPNDRYQDINDFINAVKNAKEEDVTVIHRVAPQFDDDSTQILKTGQYQVDGLDNTQIHKQNNNQASKKRKNGLFAGIATGLVLVGGLAIGITKYPEINSWLNKEELAKQQKLIESKKTINEEKERLTLEIKKNLENEEKSKAEEVEKERIKKEREKQRQLAEAELLKSEAEKLERDRVVAEKAAEAKRQAEEDKKTAESKRQREIAEAELRNLKAEKEEKDRLLAIQIASAKKQAEDDRKNAEEQLQKIEAEKKEKERILAEQIAKAKKQVEDAEKARILVEQERIEAEKKEKERILAEQIAKAKKQAEDAEKARIIAEQERVEAENKEKERILAEQIAKAKKQVEDAEKARIIVEQERIEAEKKEKERILAEQIAKAKKQAEDAEKAKILAEQVRIKTEKKELERKEQVKLDLALAEKKAAEQLKEEQLKNEQQKLAAEIAFQRKLKEAQIEKERIAEQKRKDKIAKEKKAKLDLAKKKVRDAKRKKDLAKKKIAQEKKRKAALAAKKKAEAIRRQQQQANSRGQIRVSATLNGRPFNTSFVVTKNGKRIQTIGGRASANFVLPVGRYVVATQYSGKIARANVDLQPRDIVTQSFAFRGSAPAPARKPVVKQPQKNWTHEHKQ